MNSAPVPPMGTDHQMQLDALRDAELHDYFRLEELIDTSVEQIVQAYQKTRNTWMHQSMALPHTSHMAGFSSQTMPIYAASSNAVAFNCIMPPGLKEHEVRYLAKIICREFYEYLWEPE